MQSTNIQCIAKIKGTAVKLLDNFLTALHTFSSQFSSSTPKIFLICYLQPKDLLIVSYVFRAKFK